MLGPAEEAEGRLDGPVLLENRMTKLVQLDQHNTSSNQQTSLDQHGIHACLCWNF